MRRAAPRRGRDCIVGGIRCLGLRSSCLLLSGGGSPLRFYCLSWRLYAALRRRRLACQSPCAADGRRIVAWQRNDAMGQIQTFRPHRASNRLDGSPRSESGKPARHIGAIAFILGSVALPERRLLIGNYDNVKKEPDQRAVAEEMPVSE